MPEWSLAQLERAGHECWHTLPVGGTVWLSGELGSGKTTFAQALAKAAGATGATSPTFALVHEYLSPQGPIIHVDCYRLRSPDEAADLDFADLARRARLLLVEWPERAGPHAPPPDLHLQFRHTEAQDRRLVESVPPPAAEPGRLT